MEQKKNIVQIGSFEGNDELTKIIKKIGFEQVENLFLIEPNIKCNKKLYECYQGFNITIENIVINSDETKKMDSFFISEGHESISSLLESFPTGHRGVDNVSEYLLNSSTINNFFQIKSITQVDILYISASGYDEKIIRSIDFEKFDVKEIYYENCNILNNESLVEFLDSKGYKVIRELFDFGWVNLATKNKLHLSENKVGLPVQNDNDEIIEVKYQKPHGSKWSVHNIFDKFYDKFKENYKTKYVEPIRTSEPGGVDSPHVMTLKNSKTNKYIVISYWDNAEELTMEFLGWEPKNMSSIFTSAGVRNFSNEIKPLSYPCYSLEFDELHRTSRINFEDKKLKELDFRGYLYGDRLSLSKIGQIKISSEKIYPVSEYYRSLSNNKIGLSLNGAGEICNRDIEILSAGSVLFRPKLKQKFHNGLIDGFHYISFEYNPDPEKQNKIILDRFNEIKDNEDYLKFVAENGYKWFLENGTVESNVNLLYGLIIEEITKINIPNTETKVSLDEINTIKNIDLNTEYKSEIDNKKIYFATLSLGENYTRDYACNLIDDVLKRTNHYFAITTDFPNIVTDRFGQNERILIDVINRDEVKVRIPFDHPDSHVSDFNFNMRYLCVRQLLDLEDSIVIFTDCDNSLDWWDEEQVRETFRNIYSQGKTFLGPRTEYYWKVYLQDYLNRDTPNKEYGLFWHKIYNYDLQDNPYNGWDDATLPAEYLLIFLETGDKLKKFYEQFKWFHDYLVNKGYCYGTWAEGFELGVSAFVAGYKDYDIGWNHPVLSKAIQANGHKSPENKPKHATES